jgi:hypothetical protein
LEVKKDPFEKKEKMDLQIKNSVYQYNSLLIEMTLKKVLHHQREKYHCVKVAGIMM